MGSNSLVDEIPGSLLRDPMLRRSTVLCTLVLVIGCSSEQHEVTDIPGPTADEPLSVVGTYRVDTTFETTVEELGAGSSAIDALIELRDPTTYLADKIADQVNLPKEIVVYLVEDAIGDRAQNVEDAVNEVLGEMIEWDMESRLKIDDQTRRLTMTHYAELVRTTIDGNEREFELDKPATSEIATAGVDFRDPRVTLQEHTVSLNDLTMLGAIIEAKLAPAIADGTDNIQDALLAVVDCDGIGGDIGKTACLAGVASAAENITDKLGELKTFDVDIRLIGKAEAKDSNRDSRADSLAGTWYSQFHSDGVTVDAPLEATRIGF